MCIAKLNKILIYRLRLKDNFLNNMNIYIAFCEKATR